MSQKLPVISGKEAVKAFSKVGWHVDRIAGSHAVMRKEGFDERCRHRFRGIPDIFGCSGVIKRLPYNLLDALKRHQAQTAAKLDALLPACAGSGPSGASCNISLMTSG